VVGFTGGGSEDVFAALVASGACDNVWAMCMHAGAHSNGTLTLGGVDGRLSDGPVVYVPDVGTGFHSVHVAKFTLGFSSSSAAVSNVASVDVPVDKAAILDTGTPRHRHHIPAICRSAHAERAPLSLHRSPPQLWPLVTHPIGIPRSLSSPSATAGTNVLLLPPALLSALGSAMCANTSLPQCSALWDNQCVSLTDAQIDLYPSLALELSNTTLHMTPRDYLLLGSPLGASHADSPPSPHADSPSPPHAVLATRHAASPTAAPPPPSRSRRPAARHPTALPKHWDCRSHMRQG
jgi:hypothetical protein